MIGPATRRSSSSDDEAFIDAFAAKLKIDQEKFKPLSLGEKKKFASTYVAGLIHIIATGIVHGDLKPSNVLWQRAKANIEQEAKFVISDFGGSKIVAASVAKMNEKFIFEGEDDKSKMRLVVVELLKEKPNGKMLEKNAAKVNQLKAWGIYSDTKKLQELRAYLGTEFLPAKTEGYECREYTTAACHYFWRCEESNFKNALHALDIRAGGLTIYRILTGNDTPTQKTDNPEYYNNLEVSLKARKISEKAVALIRKMSEPMKVDCTKVNAFPLPVTLEQLKELQVELQC